MGKSRIFHNIREKREERRRRRERSFVFKKEEKNGSFFGEDKNETKEEINILKIRNGRSGFSRDGNDWSI